MIVRKEKLQVYLEKRKLSRSEFAGLLGVAPSEVDKMLCGEAVGYDTAKKFIHYMKAERAPHFVNWEAIGKENPLAGEYESEDKIA